MLVTNLLSLYVDALKLSHQERDAYWDVLSMLEQRTSAPRIVCLDILIHAMWNTTTGRGSLSS